MSQTLGRLNNGIMMLASVLFVVVLLYAHSADSPEDCLAHPLSVFRDGEQPLLGFSLFALLLLIGALMTTDLIRLRRHLDLCALIPALLLLVGVAATPSTDSFHLFCSVVLLLLLYGYFALLLYSLQSLWLFVHLVVPVALLLATRCHSYGIWQKGLIVYFVIAANVHYHVLRWWLATGKKAPGARARRREGSLRRRVVFVVPAGKEWARRKRP